MNFPINQILIEEITKMDGTWWNSGGNTKCPLLYSPYFFDHTIDDLGKQSSKAQKLSKVVTSAEKLRKNPDHVLYLLKDAGANDGNGELIGYLKVAHKKLYLHDSKGNPYEVEPLCILDFYVQHTSQRRGNGKKLFDFMLKDMGLSTTQLAIDGPSEAMVKFMKSNYSLDNLMLQANNFAVSPEFFHEDPKNISRGRTPTVICNTFGRFAARKPQATISSIIHGDEDSSKRVASLVSNY